MRRSVHKRKPTKSGTVPKLAFDWRGWRYCAYCEAVIGPCADCGAAWSAPCPHCAFVMIPWDGFK